MAVSDSSQIQIKIGQKPIKNINKRQFVPKAKAQKEVSKLPVPNKTVSLVSTQHEKSRDTINQTNSSANKAHLDLLDHSKHQVINETLQKPKEEKPQLSDRRLSAEKEIREFQAIEKAVETLATPKAQEIGDEDSQLTQKYLEAQKVTTAQKEDFKDCLD